MAQRVPFPAFTASKDNRIKIELCTSESALNIPHVCDALDPDPKCACRSVWSNGCKMYANFIFGPSLAVYRLCIATRDTCVGTLNFANHMQNFRLSFDVSFSRLPDVRWTVPPSSACMRFYRIKSEIFFLTPNDLWWFLANLTRAIGSASVHAMKGGTAHHHIGVYVYQNRVTLSIRT